MKVLIALVFVCVMGAQVAVDADDDIREIAGKEEWGGIRATPLSSWVQSLYLLFYCPTEYHMGHEPGSDIRVAVFQGSPDDLTSTKP